MNNVINVNFGHSIVVAEKDYADLTEMTSSILEYLGIQLEGKQLCKYSDDLTLKNNHQYLLVWLKKYLRKYDGEEDAMKQLIPRFKEYIDCLESY